MNSSYKLSKKSIEKNKKTWQKNLPKNKKTPQKRRTETPIMDCELMNLNKMPKLKQIIGRFLYFGKEIQKKRRIAMMSSELERLWKKLNFPVVSNQRINEKLSKVISKYSNYRKKHNLAFETELEKIFDVTKVDSKLWLSNEDKKLYEKQIQSNGEIGYTTGKLAAKTSIHPSKQAFVTNFNKKGQTERDQLEDESEDVEDCSFDSTVIDYSDGENEEYTDIVSDSENESSVNRQRKKRSKTDNAVKLVIKNKLSTKKAAEVCKNLSNSGIDLPTPTQSALWKSSIKSSENMKEKIMDYIKNNKVALHFDGKRIKINRKENKEFQAVCLQSEEKNINLAILICKSGSSEDIYNELTTVLDEYEAWESVKVIICDTTNVNTGKKNGVVAKLQRNFAERGFKIQYIGCQHHVLDLILRHIMDNFVGVESKKPDINYKFVDEIQENYENLQNEYDPEKEIIIGENPGWRDDFKFLFELCEAFKFYKAENKKPNIKWRKLPSLHAARWNSRAIYALIAYFLLPLYQPDLEIIAHFISNEWSEAWFSSQKFCADKNIYNKLLRAIKRTGCDKALKSFKAHWVNEATAINVRRSNMIAERGVKVMEEIIANSKSFKYINQKFINNNDI